MPERPNQHDRDHTANHNVAGTPPPRPPVPHEAGVDLRRWIKRRQREIERLFPDQARDAAGDAGLKIAHTRADGHLYLLIKLRASPLDALTPRQREIALSVAEGLSNEQVARKFGIRRTTVAAHLRVVFGKLNVTSRASLLPALLPALQVKPSRVRSPGRTTG